MMDNQEIRAAGKALVDAYSDVRDHVDTLAAQLARGAANRMSHVAANDIQARNVRDTVIAQLAAAQKALQASSQLTRYMVEAPTRMRDLQSTVAQMRVQIEDRVNMEDLRVAVKDYTHGSNREDAAALATTYNKVGAALKALREAMLATVGTWEPVVVPEPLADPPSLPVVAPDEIPSTAFGEPLFSADYSLRRTLENATNSYSEDATETEDEDEDDDADEPYRCEECGAGFSMREEYEDHIVNEHGDDDEDNG